MEKYISASKKVKEALALPLPELEIDCGCEGFFDPWEIFPCFYGSYSGEFDAMAIKVLTRLRDGVFEREDLACEMFREYLCVMGLCDYGTSPRVCFPTMEFRPLLPDLIDKWRAYSLVRWGEDVTVEE